MRFDDSLKTVLAADTSTPLGARAAFRQLADLIARRRVPARDDLIERLMVLRGEVAVDVRAAVARALALADPPVALVRLFVDDRPEVAGAVLRAVRLHPDAWEPLIAEAGPFGRSVLRRRSDLPPSAIAALARFAATDLALPAAEPIQAPAPTAAAQQRDEPTAPDVPEARARTGGSERFEIADLVHRIEEFQRDRTAAIPAAPAPVRAFRFETDGNGVIRWVDTAPRGAVIGLSLRDGSSEAGAGAGVDGSAAGAFRKRAAIGSARLTIGGTSALGGEWRIAATPLFDTASGRFLGYRGHARRPHAHETATVPRAPGNAAQVEGLRRLVHELRTPTNAIAGFSELIESELLGPVPGSYRTRAGVIRHQVAALIAAIDDLELAARIDGNALELRPGQLALAPLLGDIVGELAPLLRRRGSAVRIERGEDVAAEIDERAGTRLVTRLVTSLVAISEAGETLAISLGHAGDDQVRLAIARPRVLRGLDDAALFALETPALAPGEDFDDDAPLLGLGFALRLLRNLAVELGGRLTIDPGSLTVTLPAALNDEMERARTFTT